VIVIDTAISRPMFDRKSLTKLIIPLIAEQFLLIAVGMADTMMVSSVGEAAVSGISLVDQINNLLIQLFAALAAGGSVVCAQYIGKREYDNAGQSAKQLLYAATGLALVIGAIAIAWNAPIIDLIYGALDADVRTNAITYFYLTAASFPFLALYNAGAALMRAKGNSRISLILSIIMNCINVCGNALLIYVCKWGVAGAATATLVARIVTAVVITYLLTKKDPVMYVKKIFSYRPDPAMIRRILHIGIPNGVENCMFHLGRLMVAGLVASFGTASIAANAVCGSVCGIPAIPGSAIGMALVTVVGQCIGADETKQAEIYTRKLMLLSYSLALLMNALMFVCAAPIVRIYNISPEATEIAVTITKSFAIFAFLFWPAAFVLPNALRAAGDVRFSMVTSMISMWTMRVAASYVLGGWLGWGVYGTWAGMYLDWVLRTICFVVRFLRGKWKHFKVV